ncbi:PREDICTED: uncharacterized protein LOC109587682 [Amphimedon queenslandica]|uniref:Uncharacterized protein n=1 Tax=Amphimedon queenslandica TaxID=400682 RepID=A0AAN0JRI3_AMPQE|nr:PREDICTED: uncharacterized protein LOC109587682 [Amphimedon queenslandica]|eukprot:XP_019859462.1 PREDICTED: uncharacterized protein LOC109587682 [Amphimedon queenslandica]
MSVSIKEGDGESEDESETFCSESQEESKHVDKNTGDWYHKCIPGKDSPVNEKKRHYSEPQPSTDLSDKLFDVHPNWLKDGMLDSTIKVKVTPMLLINCGLPSSRKTTTLKKVLRAASNLKEEDGIGFCDMLAARNLIHNKIVFMPQLQESKGYLSVMYAGVENVARSSAKTIRVLPSNNFSGFSSQDLNDHFTAIMEDLHKKYLKKQHDEPTEWDQSHTGGLALINVWDLGLNKIPTYVLSHLAGHLYNSHVWMFLDLLRDVDHLYDVPDIPENRYDKSRNDRELIMRWRSRIRYFFRFAKLASTKNGNRKKVCSVIASHNGSTNLEEKMKKLKDAVSTVSKQLGLQDLIDMEKFKDFHNEDIEPLCKLLEKRIKDGLDYHAEEVPLSFMFLRSLFYKKDQLYIMKEELEALSKELNMDNEKFQNFCCFFTSFGSIIDVSLIDPSSNLIILQPVSFLNKLDKLFYYSPGDPIVTSHGFVSKATAEAIFNEKDENALIFMSFLKSLRVATKILPGQIKTAIDKWGYYIPNICNRPPILQCSPTSLHLVHDMNISLSHFKVTFTANFLESYPKAQLDVSRTPHINVTQFCSRSNDCLFELVYLGDIIEFRFPDLDKELLHEVCEHIVIKCHEIMNDSDVLYNFAIMCERSERSCKLQMERHALPFKDECEECFGTMSNQDVKKIEVFNSVLTKVSLSSYLFLNLHFRAA